MSPVPGVQACFQSLDSRGASVGPQSLCHHRHQLPSSPVTPKSLPHLSAGSSLLHSGCDVLKRYSDYDVPSRSTLAATSSTEVLWLQERDLPRTSAAAASHTNCSSHLNYSITYFYTHGHTVLIYACIPTQLKRDSPISSS